MSLEGNLRAAGWTYDDLIAVLSPYKKENGKRGKCWISPIDDRHNKVIDARSTPATAKSSVRKQFYRPIDDEVQSLSIDMTAKLELASAAQLSENSYDVNLLENIDQSPSNSRPQLFQTAKILLSQSEHKTKVNDCEKVPDENFEKLVGTLEQPLPNGWRLFPHQKEAIKHCLSLRRAILAYDMGLGKTLIGLIWAKILCEYLNGSCVTVVVCPCTLQETWTREADMVGFRTITLENIMSLGSLSTSIAPVLIICSWSKLITVDHLNRLKVGNKCSSAPKFVLICDEAHSMQSMSSQRTQAALTLCLNSSCEGVLLSTGTPMKNGRPANLFPLLVAIQHPLARHKPSFDMRYCEAKRTPYCAWDITGAAHLDELRAIIGASIIRKTKV